MTKYFGMPADFKNETVDKYAELNSQYQDSRVIETYGQLTLNNSIESGRSLDLLPKIDFDTLASYVKYSKERDIDFNYTINASYMRNREFTTDGALQIKRFLGDLYEAGVRWLTITLPSLMELVRSVKYDFHIKASTICQITNVNKAMWFKNIGAERIVLDESINRNFDALKRITGAFGDKVEVIVNSICHKDCINRVFHYNQISGDSVEISSEASTNYYPHKCAIKRFENIGNLLRLSWIRPEDIKYYSAVGIKYFKLQGRHLVLNGDPARTVEYYFKESFDGDLMELFDMFAPTNSFRVKVDNKKLDGFIKPFYENISFCKSDCMKCKYCEQYARKCIDCDEAEEMAEMANMFYGQMDLFKNHLKSVLE